MLAEKPLALIREEGDLLLGHAGVSPFVDLNGRGTAIAHEEARQPAPIRPGVSLTETATGVAATPRRGADKELPNDRSVSYRSEITTSLAAHDVPEITRLDLLAFGVPHEISRPPASAGGGRGGADRPRHRSRVATGSNGMKPSDPTAVSKRFAAVLARGLARADVEIAEHFARLRARPTEDRQTERPPWFNDTPGSRDSRDADDAWLDDDV
jgi:hypothetical protein